MNRSPSRYTYSERAGRYRDTRTGRWVSAAAIRAELDASIKQSAAVIREASEAARAGKMSLSEWQLRMAAEIRNSQLASHALAKGGWAQMTQADYARAARSIREQYTFLQKFAADVASGKQKLDGTFSRRSMQYIASARTHYHDVLRRENVIAGRLMICSIRHARDSCEDCIRLNGVWFRHDDPQYIPVGRRRCRGNCLCTEKHATEEEVSAAA